MDFCNKGDYVVYRDGKRKIFGSIRHVDDKERVYKILPEKLRGSDNEERFEVGFDDIIAYLGPNPEFGSVYGQKTEVLIDEYESKTWGRIEIYRSINEEEMDAINTGLKAAVKLMKEHGVARWLPINSLEIRNPRGKWAGLYRKSKDEQSIVYMPKHIEAAETCDLMLHEGGHGFWFNNVPAKVRARWVELYRDMVELHNYTHDEVLAVCQAFAESDGSCDDFASSLEDNNEQIIFGEFLAYVKNTHLLDVEDLDYLKLIEADLTNLFPDEGIVLTDQIGLPTEYSGVNTRELFAESFRIYVGGGKLPERLKKAMEKTIQLQVG